MTEKRFTLKNWNDYVEGDCIYYDNGEEMGSLDVLDTLNELNDENQMLKKTNKMTESTYHALQKKFHNWDISLSKCREENKELIEEIIEWKSKYFEAMDTVINEYSTNIKEDMKKLEKEVWGD